MPLPKPIYTMWQGISTALALATRALNEVRALARIPGPQGEKGEKGEAGLGFTDMTYDGERRITFKRFDDAIVIVMPILIDRGVWKVDHAYERGDCISYDGGLWSAQVDIQGERPGREKGWRLMVKQPRAKL